MSSFLLDTHTWMWALDRPENLNPGARRLIEKADSELYLSPVSIWEAYHLSKRRRLRHKGTFQQWLDIAVRVLPLREAPLNFAVGKEATRLQLTQSDVGDLFVAATAVVFGLTLVTADRDLLAHASIKTLRAD